MITLSPVELASLAGRLRQVQQDVEDAEAALAARKEQRRRLVVETVDSGAMGPREVARQLGEPGKPKSPGLVVKILAKPDPDDDGQ